MKGDAMKALIIIIILLTFLVVLLKYKKDKDVKKLLFTIASFGFVISMALVGNLTRPIIPLYLTHMILIIVAWASLFMYIFKDKYCWWWIISPSITIVLFLILTWLGGAAHN